MLAFDLVINTARVSSTLATTWVVEAVKAFKAAPVKGQPRTSSIPVDTVLGEAVSEQLKCKIAHW
jgi:hypothetical protein